MEADGFDPMARPERSVSQVQSAARRWEPSRGKLHAAAWAALVSVLALMVSGCVGPNFVPPPAPDAEGYLPGKLAAASGGPGAGPPVATQHFVSGADVSARWWAAFRSEPLNGLIRQSVEHNPTLQSAEAAIKIANYNALAQRGIWLPQITGSSVAIWVRYPRRSSHWLPTR
jgi:outer membrane protein TolC